MNRQQMDNVHRQPGLISFLQTWWQSHLFGTKVILTFSIILGLIDLVTHFAFNIFSNSPCSTLPIQIQRLFFANFVHYYSIDLILAIICIHSKLKDFETKHGTATFIIIITILGFITQSLCLILQFTLSYLYPPFYETPAYSLWNFTIFFLIQECLMMPNGQSQFLIFPMQIKNKYYPIVFVILFTLIQQSLTFVSSFIIAIIYFLFQDRFSLQTATIEQLEKGIVFRPFIDRIDFKTISNYQDQLEPSVDSREQPYLQTPPAKLTMEGCAPFPPSLVLQELQKQLNVQDIPNREEVQEEEEQKQVEQNQDF
ncbi:unnamed protein product (macronuclear) [Paramecium tetraurelia]|uniref:Peptidase S54 rhomboid domain-containing protein n=1 Tax=Paramecium tetraurelia TaxID=5888 RepID=A0CGL5_PARTE|nr:uncharacterized protein GSPATT00007372001 [Paramecium tetraurelia]CAK69932.1 unnamed protein product [Paramecium tetraurelia]|eukprot:XP_001437329.1 hypothetical protein (macronuclear) [Paramecium tetraurelia strain d4-2]